MARRTTGNTWAPTASGQTVLYGVDGFDDGFLVLRQATSKGRLLFGRMAEYREIQDAAAKGGVRLIPEVAESRRGTWRMEGDAEEPTIVLLLDGNEVDRFVLKPSGQMEKPAERKREFAETAPADV